MGSQRLSSFKCVKKKKEEDEVVILGQEKGRDNNYERNKDSKFLYFRWFSIFEFCDSGIVS